MVGDLILGGSVCLIVAIMLVQVFYLLKPDPHWEVEVTNAKCFAVRWSENGQWVRIFETLDDAYAFIDYLNASQINLATWRCRCLS